MKIYIRSLMVLIAILYQGLYGFDTKLNHDLEERRNKTTIRINEIKTRDQDPV